jgi:RNA polymerase sigma factor (sigma-70 family)
MTSDDRKLSLSRAPQPFASARFAETPSDELLLGRFVDQWDQGAFRDLVDRHGPMVLGVCGRILRDPHAAEDAFQVTFLLLARKAGSVRKRGSVGPWLYGVARRVALEARGVTSRRQVPVLLDPEAPGMDEHNALERDELHVALHEELGRLSEKYRAPLVLCYIEGLPHEVIARQLGWPIGTVRGRIARGRDLLGARLSRRGLTPAAVLLALGLLPETVGAVPVRLVEATVRAAARVAAGEGVPRGEVPTRVADLERKVRKGMHLMRLKWATAFALAFIVAGAGVAALVPRAVAAAEDAAKVEAERKKLQGTWVVVSLQEDGAEKQANGHLQLKIDGETFTMLDGDRLTGKGPFTLDPSRDPMEMDLKFREGKERGKTGLAIYAWDGANLKFCGADSKEKRPTGFTTMPGDDRILLILKRQGP